jgi:hypothetical protein
LLRELAGEGGVRVPVAGDCMAPVVLAGERVRLERARRYWPGDLIAFRTESGGLRLHRLIGWRPTARGWRLLTQADNADRPDAPVDPREVIGRLVESDDRRVRIALAERLRAGGRFLRFVAAKVFKTRATADCGRG